MIVIIGASCAGLFAAYLLAKEGFPVCVFEENEKLDLSPRTLIVTSKINEVLGFVPSEAVINSIREVELFSRNRSVKLKLGYPDLVLERKELSSLLARKAKQEGAEIELGFRFLGLREEPDGLVLRVENLRNNRVEHLKTNTLIGADGTLSDVADAIGRRNGENAVAILQAKAVLPTAMRKDTIRIWFNREETGFFYWLIPESEREAVVGLISANSRAIKTSLTKFLDARKFKVLGFQEGKVPLYDPQLVVSRKTSGANICFVGDAAAQVKVTTMGGVVAGLRGAKALARAIAQGDDYENELKELRRELGLQLRMRHILDKFTDSDYDQLLGFLNEKTRDILATYNRDEVSRAVFKLLLAQPKFLVFAKKFL